MANFTAKAIKTTFLELLEERPLSDITVKDIVEACGINRNSFYYHYQDIPSLLEEIIREESENIIKNYPSISGIVECYDAVTEFALGRKRTIMHIYKSSSRESFEAKLTATCEYFMNKYVETVVAEKEVNDEELEVVKHFYRCVLFGLILDWLNGGMSEESRERVRKVLIVGKEHAGQLVGMLNNK